MEVSLNSYAAVAAQQHEMVANNTNSSTIGGAESHASSTGNQQQQQHNQQHTTTTTTMKQQPAYERLLHPKPESLTLIAALQLLQPLQVGDTVYLLPVDYVQNWLCWAYQQRCVNDPEQTRAREALKHAAVQLHLIAPTQESTYHNPGPMDAATSLAVQGHPLVLQPTVRLHRGHKVMMNGDANSTVSTMSHHHLSSTVASRLKAPPPINGAHHHGRSPSHSGALPLSPSSSATTSLGGPISMKRQSSSSQLKLPPVPATTKHARAAASSSSSSRHHHNRDPMSASMNKASLIMNGTSGSGGGGAGSSGGGGSPANGSSSHSTTMNITSNHQHGGPPECLAVPETFYATLRSVHGVICQDGYTISFQPPLDRRERILLHHEISQRSSNQHNNNSSNNNASKFGGNGDLSVNTSPTSMAGADATLFMNGTMYHHHNNSNGGGSSGKPRDATPVEFRRKVIAQATGASAKFTQDQLEHMSLMDRLMIEEERRQRPRLPVPEIHPIKLLYRVHRGNNNNPQQQQQQSQSQAVPQGPPTTKAAASQYDGFVLVSQEAVTVDALSAMIKAAAPKASSQTVRLWSRYLYPWNGATTAATSATTTTSSSATTTRKTTQPQQAAPSASEKDKDATGSSFELIDFAQMTLQDAKAKIPLTIGEWAQRHSVQGTERQIECLIELRPNMNAPWPRESLELMKRIQVGDYCDAQDVAGKWYEARVCDVQDESITVHYFGWASRWNSRLKRWPTSTIEGLANKLHPPAPLWSQTQRWRERIQVGDIIEVRDTSSLVHRPKWYKGEVKQIGKRTDPVRELQGGADLELYPVVVEVENNSSSLGGGGGTENNNNNNNIGEDLNGGGNSKSGDETETTGGTDDYTTDDANDSNSNNGSANKGQPLRLLDRGQQILVEVAQERTEKAGAVVFPETAAPSGSSDQNTSASGLVPEPPFLRWVDLYGEEICQMGTHLKLDDEMKSPSILKYELEQGRKPVEIMKSHPSLGGAGFMRESLRGAPPAPGSVGLHNLGNSCFLNSTVQCLNHMEIITQYFLRDSHVTELNRQNPLGSGGNVAMAYASLVKKMWSGDYSVLAPRSLKQTVAAFAPQFDNSYQHDSQEFCQFLMDGLHEDLNRVKQKPYVEELEGFGMDDQQAAVESWRKHLLRHDSIFVDHCQGMHRSHLTCPQCGRESIKFDVYSSISLPLASKKDHSAIQLEDCIEMFMEGEQLDERNAWYCPSCRRHVCALKLIALWSAPDILILHLKRFQFDTCMTSGGMLRSKIDDTVDFPIEGLDLTRFILGPIDKDAPPIYKLFGVSEHTGFTANSGHYTATVRNSIDGQWYRCNDSHVGGTSGEASITGGAYLLFYQREKGSSRWAGMEKVMTDRAINPYGALEEDQEGFKRVKTKKKKKGGR